MVQGCILLAIVIVAFFASKAILKSMKSGGCVGCSDGCCGSCGSSKGSCCGNKK